jgi:hypothetical protein
MTVLVKAVVIKRRSIVTLSRPPKIDIIKTSENNYAGISD